jgi:hypothetical protein
MPPKKPTQKPAPKPLAADPLSTYFHAYWQGQMPLWGAFWVWGMGVGTLVGLVFTLISVPILGNYAMLRLTEQDPLMTIISGYAVAVMYGFWLTFYAWHLVSVWRCAAHAAPLARWSARAFVLAVALTYWPLYALTMWVRFF